MLLALGLVFVVLFGVAGLLVLRLLLFLVRPFLEGHVFRALALAVLGLVAVLFYLGGVGFFFRLRVLRGLHRSQSLRLAEFGVHCQQLRFERPQIALLTRQPDHQRLERRVLG